MPRSQLAESICSKDHPQRDDPDQPATTHARVIGTGAFPAVMMGADPSNFALGPLRVSVVWGPTSGQYHSQHRLNWSAEKRASWPETDNGAWAPAGTAWVAVLQGTAAGPGPKRTPPEAIGVRGGSPLARTLPQLGKDAYRGSFRG